MYDHTALIIAQICHWKLHLQNVLRLPVIPGKGIYKMNFIQGKYLGFFAQDFLDGLHFAFVCDLWIYHHLDIPR